MTINSAIDSTPSRRGFLSAAVMLGAGGILTSCAAPSESYETAADTTWRASDPHTDAKMETGSSNHDALRRELIRYATLAPSSHNTQCWIFRSDAGGVTISPDFRRRCPAVDPDEHHLYISLGCATENLVIAAAAHGFAGEVDFDPSGDGTIRIALKSGRAQSSALYDAIPRRQCTRTEFDAQSLTREELHALATAGSGPGLDILLVDEKPQIEQVLEFVLQGNTTQLHDRAFMRELVSWIRFNDEEAVSTRDGLFTRTTGNPVMPRVIGAVLLGVFLTPHSENNTYTRCIRSSAGIAVFSTEHATRAQWIEVGRAYERFVLTATALDICTAMINQPVEVAELRPQFAAALGLGIRRPDLVVRFGRGPKMPRSLRRPISAVIASA